MRTEIRNSFKSFKFSAYNLRYKTMLLNHTSFKYCGRTIV